MGGIFDYATTNSRAPSVPLPNGIQEYYASTKAWSSQSKRVKNCSTSIELLYKDITRLNLLLRFLKSPKSDSILKMRLFTCVDVNSKLSKLLWKFNNNTIIRCDLVNITTLPPLSIKDKNELSRPSHPHQTPGFKQQHQPQQPQQQQPQQQQQDEEKKEKAKGDKKPKVINSFVLTINEFYYLFLFLEDKLPELSSWLMKQSDSNQNNILLKALSVKTLNLLNKNDKNGDNPLIDDNDEEKEEKKNDNELIQQQMMMGQEEMNEIDDDHCIICFEKLQNPVCLTCGHEYCKDCIDDWQHQIGGKECPICRCMIEQSQMWVKMDSEDFSKAQYMMELLEFPFEYCSKFPKWSDTMIQ